MFSFQTVANNARGAAASRPNPPPPPHGRTYVSIIINASRFPGEARVLKDSQLCHPASESKKERDLSFFNLTGHPSGLSRSLVAYRDWSKNARDSIVDVPWVVVTRCTSVLDTPGGFVEAVRGRRWMQIDGWAVRLGWSNASRCSLMSPITSYGGELGGILGSLLTTRISEWIWQRKIGSMGLGSPIL